MLRKLIMGIVAGLVVVGCGSDGMVGNDPPPPLAIVQRLAVPVAIVIPPEVRSFEYRVDSRRTIPVGAILKDACIEYASRRFREVRVVDEFRAVQSAELALHVGLPSPSFWFMLDSTTGMFSSSTFQITVQFSAFVGDRMLATKITQMSPVQSWIPPFTSVTMASQEKIGREVMAATVKGVEVLLSTEAVGEYIRESANVR